MSLMQRLAKLLLLALQRRREVSAASTCVQPAYRCGLCLLCSPEMKPCSHLTLAATHSAGLPLVLWSSHTAVTKADMSALQVLQQASGASCACSIRATALQVLHRFIWSP